MVKDRNQWKRGLEVQSHAYLQSKFEVSLGYTRLKKTKPTKQQQTKHGRCKINPLVPVV